MAANSPVFELLQRNEDEFVGRDLIIAGDILDPMVFSLVKRSHSATVIVDNFVVCKKMAAMIGKSMDDSCPQIIEYKHVKLIFADVKSALTHTNEADTLLLLLSKSKQQTLKLLNTLKTKLKKDALVYTAGSNDGGAKSADSLLKPLGFVKKVDLARKCTLFKAIYENDFNTYKGAQDIKVNPINIPLTLHQDSAVFSQGKLDKGTAMLIECLKDLTPFGTALDLGCGCGVVGLVLSKLGFKNVTSTDVSAAAIELTKENAKLNGCESIKVKASDMLTGLERFDLIAVNPPFHVGVTTTTAPTVNMIIEAKDHLTKNGVMYLVANAHLGYEKVLLENFDYVQIVSSSTTFIVYKARLEEK